MWRAYDVGYRMITRGGKSTIFDHETQIRDRVLAGASTTNVS